MSVVKGRAKHAYGLKKKMINCKEIYSLTMVEW